MDKQYTKFMPRPIPKLSKTTHKNPKNSLSFYIQFDIARRISCLRKLPQTSLYTLDNVTYLKGTARNVVYFNQADPRWGNKLYGGNDPISKYGCGPTAAAMVVSSMTNRVVLPDEMADWSRTNGLFCSRKWFLPFSNTQCCTGFWFRKLLSSYRLYL